MKRYKFSQYEGIDLISPFVNIPEENVQPSKDEGVFQLIYAADPVTGRARSDLGTYMSENTNPLVREFIEKQLRTDFSHNSVPVPDGINERDIIALTRDSKETVDSYVGRINAYMMSQKVSVQQAQRRADVARRKAVLDKKTLKSE